MATAPEEKTDKPQATASKPKKSAHKPKVSTAKRKTTAKRKATAKKSRKKPDKGSINKAEEIRKAAKEIGGKKVRPKDVVAALAEKGITVAPAQVSTTLKKAGYRRIRKAKKVAGASKTHHAVEGGELTLEHLLAAKALISKIGVEAAQKAIHALAKLG